MPIFQVRHGLHAAGAIVLATLLVACQRNDAPTPGVSGNSANPPATSASAPPAMPAAPESTTGTGKSPGMDTPPGSSGAGGTMPAPTPEPTQNPASAPPAVPPASAPAG
jgi:hypothetical protein